MASWGLDLLSKLAESTSLDILREDFPRKCDEGLNPAQFLAVVRRHVDHDDNIFAATNDGGGGHEHHGIHGQQRHSEAGDISSKVEEVFKQMDVRGDGEVSWEDFSQFVLQLELLHDSKGAAENEHCFRHVAAHLGMDGHVRGGVSRVDYLPDPVDKIGLITKGNEVVHLVGQGNLEDDDEAPFSVLSGGGSDLARMSCSLRHDTAYKPHEVNAVHSVPGQDVVITSSSIGPSGPHVLTVWDLPTQEERSSEKQFLPALTSREETPTRQTVIFWAPAVEMVLTGSSGNGSLLGWELGPLRQSAKLWLHDAGITHVHELVGHAGGAPHLVTASLDGTIAVCGGATKGASRGDGVLQRLQAHEKGVAHMAFCLHHSIALSAGVFVNTVDTTPDVLVWRLDRDRGLLEHDTRTRLRGHDGQVVGMVFAEEELELVTGGADGKFLVWHMPSLVLKQRFTRSNASPLADQAISCFSMVPRSADRPLLLVAGMKKTAGLEIFARVEKRVHEALIKAEFCPYLERFVTVSARRATVWDGKSGEALTTLTSARLLGNDQADITAFSLDHQGHKLVVGADTGDIRACFSHSGSIIRQLDPHDGPVNWLSFASRKTDKCVFSIGGDGALHVLDDADANGYEKPPGTSGARRKPRKGVASNFNTPGRVASGGGAQSNHNDEESGAVFSDDDHSGGKQGGRRSQQRTAARHGRWGAEDVKRGPGGTILPGEEAKAGEGGGAEEAGNSLVPADAVPADVNTKGDGGRSVLLRQVVLSSNDDDDHHDGANNGDELNDKDDRERGRDEGRRSHDPIDRSDRQGPGLSPSQQPRGTIGASSPELDTLDDGLSAEPLRDPPGSASSSGKSRFARTARALMSSSFREELLERELSAGGKNTDAVSGGLLYAKPTFDMTACAADDHLSVIATAATSDGGIERNKPSDRDDTRGEGRTSSSSSSRAGRPSSSLHLWDADTMSLVGTLLLPCLALTRDLANAAAAFSVHSPSVVASGFPAAESEATCSHPPAEARGGTGAGPASSSPEDVGNMATAAVSAPPSPDAQQRQQQPAAPVKAGTGLSRPALVTAVGFLSPYPLLMGTSTGGAVVLWRTSDCVCVQAILLPADLGSLRRRQAGSSGQAAEEGTAEEEQNLVCLARGTFTTAGGRETTAVYVGNGNGDIVVAHLSPAELAELSGDANGPVPCQRRANHNPYRAVRVELTQQAANISLQVACRAQREAATRAGAGQETRVAKPRRAKTGATKDAAGGYNFAVPSSGFHEAWKGHSAAVSSLSWIRSPPSLLSSSADGLAKIWKSDGSAILGQLDINNKRPERALFLPQDARRQWNFVPGSTADGRHQRDLGQQPAPATADGNTAAGVSHDGTTHEKEPTSNGSVGPQEGDAGGEGERKYVRTEEGGIESGCGAGSKGRRGWSRLPKEQQRATKQRQQREELAGEGGLASKPPDSTRFSMAPITTTGSATQTALPERELRGGKTASSCARACVGAGDGVARKRVAGGVGLKPSTSSEKKTKELQQLAGRGTKPSWMSGWDCMARQLKDFEETLEASSSARKKRVNSFQLGKPSPSAMAHPVRKTPLYGKRWRTKSSPWPAEDDKHLETSVSERGLPTAGSVRLGGNKGKRGYVKPTPGSAENAALKRSTSRGATGLVLKDTLSDKSREDLIRGRPLDEWLAMPEDGRVVQASDAAGDGVASEAAMGKTIKGLPPVAILAGSRGGRLVASGITIAGDRGGGGFNVKAAKAAARTARRQAALAEEVAREEQRSKARGARAGPRQEAPAALGKMRDPMQGALGGKRKGDRGAPSWGWGRHEGNRKPTSAAASHPSNGGSVAPSFGGGAHSSGSVGSGGGGSTVTMEVGSLSTPSVQERPGARIVVEAARSRRGLNEDSVLWASSRRGSARSSWSTKNPQRREEDGAGQVETIRRLVHMGLF